MALTAFMLLVLPAAAKGLRNVCAAGHCTKCTEITFCETRVPIRSDKAVPKIQGCCAIAGNVADNMAEGYKDSQYQLSSATQHVTHAKANWRQARPPKAADVNQEQPDPDLQNGAAFIAGTVSDLLRPVIRFTAAITVTAFHQRLKQHAL